MGVGFCFYMFPVSVVSFGYLWNGNIRQPIAGSGKCILCRLEQVKMNLFLRKKRKRTEGGVVSVIDRCQPFG